MISYRIKKTLLYLFIIMQFCYIFFHTNSIVYAINGNSNGYQFVYDELGNTMFTIDVYEDGTIYFFGKHSKSTSKYTYHTTAFNMSLDHTNKNPRAMNNRARIERKSVDGYVEIPGDFWEDEYTIDIYKLDSNDVISNLVQLLKNKGYSTQGAYKKISNGIDVYFSNIFEVVEREGLVKVGTKEYETYEEINNALYQLKGIRWTQATQNLLKCYYDNIINIRLSPFFYDVKYVDANDYKKNGTKAKELKSGGENLEIYFGQNTGFETPSEEELLINKKQYMISKVEYVYDSGQANSINKPTITTNEISAYHGSKHNATMYLLLEEIEKGPLTTPIVTPPIVTPPSTSTNSISYMNANASGQINVQPSTNTGFDATIGVPTTENLYGSIQTSEYLIQIQYKNHQGQITYPITVQKTYEITTTDEMTKKEVVEERTVTQSGYVTRSYSYNTIESIDYYKIEKGSLTNQTLPTDSLTLLPKNYSVPVLTYRHYETEREHIKEPSEVGTTIGLPSEKVDSLPSEDLISMASGQIGAIKVRNDSLNFGSSTVLNDQWTQQTGQAVQTSLIKAPAKTKSSILYEENQQILSTLRNATYDSTGTITYERVVGYRSTNPDLLTFSIENVNSVKIHTPVYCDALIEHDNNQYLQLLSPNSGAIPLMIDENAITGDFYLTISNTGYHSSKAGYGTKNYNRYLAKVDGIAQNEVQFPIDLYKDIGNDGNLANDILLPADTWDCIGTQAQRYYVPMWVKEDIYTAHVRSVAVNGVTQLTKQQETKNALESRYVATDTFAIEVSGRLYGLTMYDVNNYPLWQEVFRQESSLVLKRNLAYSNTLTAGKYNVLLANGTAKEGFSAKSVYDYTLGGNDSYGHLTTRRNQYTLPIVVGGHPRYSNQGILTAGYVMRFVVHTTGDKMSDPNAKIEVAPRFFYVDRNGKNRVEVDLYYKGVVDGKQYSLIQIGSSVDLKNVKSATLNDTGLSIPEEEQLATAKIYGIPVSNLKKKSGELYTYAKITVGSVFRMYSNLTYAKQYQSKDHSLQELQMQKQSFYFNYSLPGSVKAVKKGSDLSEYVKKYGINGKEDFWLTDGYLIVNFDLVAKDSNGVRYSYINKSNYQNAGFCSMWLMEGGAIAKTDVNGITFQFLAGDCLIFPTDKTSEDDFASDGLY